MMIQMDGVEEKRRELINETLTYIAVALSLQN